MKFAIVMTYYDRYPQTLKTLSSFDQYENLDYQVIIVDDCSPVKDLFPAKNIIHLRLENKKWFNSAIPYNTGFYYALLSNPDIIIIQNSECYHAGNILEYAQKYLTDSNYISFPCYSLGINTKLPPDVLWPCGAGYNGDDAWYNHPIYRNVGYHFCSAITADNLRKINGFDERFKDGCDWEDNYLLHQIRTLGLKIEIPEEPIVYHQWHYTSDRPRGMSDNGKIYQELIRENHFRAKHLLTEDL